MLCLSSRGVASFSKSKSSGKPEAYHPSGDKAAKKNRHLPLTSLRRSKTGESITVHCIGLPRQRIVFHVLVANNLHRQDHAYAAQAILLRDAVIDDPAVRAHAK